MTITATDTDLTSPDGEGKAKKKPQWHGKWSMIGVPRRGWRCIHVEDLGDLLAICQMCEKEPIRHVHSMVHEEYPRTLYCGCICAGNMEGNLSRAKAREDAITAWKKKRDRWLERRWLKSRKGNPWIKAYGYRIVIFPRGKNYAASISGLDDEEEYNYFTQTCPTSDAAKLAAFDAIVERFWELDPDGLLDPTPTGRPLSVMSL